MSRIVSHAHLVTPDEPHEPILSEHHDYYTLWGQWRGIDPLWLAHASGQPGRLGFIDAEHAMTSGLLTADEVRRAIAGSRKQLVLAGCDETMLDDHQFLFIFDSQGRLQKDPNGNYDVALAFDALTSLDLGLIDETIYTRLVQDMADRLREAGYEALNLTGSHLLLSFDTHGRLRTSELGELEAALCNFDLIAPIDPKNAFINQD